MARAGLFFFSILKSLNDFLWQNISPQKFNNLGILSQNNFVAPFVNLDPMAAPDSLFAMQIFSVSVSPIVACAIYLESEIVRGEVEIQNIKPLIDIYDVLEDVIYFERVED